MVSPASGSKPPAPPAQAPGSGGAAEGQENSGWQISNKVAALADQDYLTEAKANIAAARTRIADIARDNGLTALPSATNFVALDTHRDGAFARRLLAALADEGIFARMPGTAPMDRCIRVSCGPAPELAAFAEALPRALRTIL